MSEDHPAGTDKKDAPLWIASALILALVATLAFFLGISFADRKNIADAPRPEETPTLSPMLDLKRADILPAEPPALPARDPAQGAPAPEDMVPSSEQAALGLKQAAPASERAAPVAEEPAALAVQSNSFAPEIVEATNVQASGGETTEVAKAEEEALQAARQELIAFARRTFAVKNDPRFADDKELLEVANAVAVFYVRCPTREECVRFLYLCDKLAEKERPEEITLALKGSKFLFEDEVAMMDKGYTRYGRSYADSNTLALIFMRLGLRTKEVDAYLSKRRQEDGAALRANRRAAEQPAKSVSSKSPVTKSKRKIRRIGEDTNMDELVRPNTPIRRIGEDTDMSQLKRPDTPIRRLGESDETE